MTTISLRVPDGAMSAYFAMPVGDGACPAVVMIHDILGMTHDLRHQADWMASEGYLVLAPDLFDGGTILGCVRTVTRNISQGEGALFERLEAARQWLLRHELCTGKVGVIGFCLGGGFALLLAPRDEYAVASAVYPSIPKGADKFLKGACPIVASFGGADPMLKGAASKLETILTEQGVEHDVKEYPGAGHDFMSDRSQDKMPFLIKVVSAALGGKYDAAATKDTRTRIRDFFERYLKATV